MIFYYLSLSSLHSFFYHCFEGKILLEEAQIFLSSLFSERLVGVLFFGGVVFYFNGLYLSCLLCYFIV